MKVQPLEKLLREAIDGGERLHDQLWHPLNVPMVHQPDAVLKLQLAGAWAAATSENGNPDEGDWYAIEISKVLDVFSYASTRGMCIARFL